MDRYEFWDFVAGWVERLARARTARGPLMVGLCAPQGVGKTTLTKAVCETLAGRGLRAVSLSIDDFYLTRAEQVALAGANPDNPYFSQRGQAGTHDVALGAQTLQALKGLSGAGAVRVPAYERSAFGGLGDRKPEADWTVVAGPLDVVLLEGWMLGFTPVPLATIADLNMLAVNGRLADYAAWDAVLDAFIWLEPEDFRYVLDWRAEAEAKAIAAGRPGLSPEAIQAFIEKFLRGYETYYPGLRLGSSVDGPYLHLVVGRDRLPVKALPRD